MSEDENFKEIQPAAASVVPTAAQVAFGIPVPPVSLLRVMSPNDWEAFTEEWLSFHRTAETYIAVTRYSGPGDLGLDVVAFSSVGKFTAPWDSYQCKHYDHALRPGDVWGEIAKIIFHSFNRTPPFNQSERVPRRHIFVAPDGVGISLKKLLDDPSRLKDEVRAKWYSHCIPALGKGTTAPLKADFLDYFNAFDFSIFEYRTGVELIDEHARTPFYAPRFGGGLPPRYANMSPPDEPTAEESLYLRKLMDAYANHLGQYVESKDALSTESDLAAHYDRQRVLFYRAESLRNFARDRTPPKTFEALQDDIYHGVIDICESQHADALVRLRATLSSAASIGIDGSALVSVTGPADKQGICHQLANEDRLTWTVDDA